MEEKQTLTRTEFTLMKCNIDGADVTFSATENKQSFFLEELKSMDFKKEANSFLIRHPKEGWVRVVESPWERIEQS